MFSSTAASISLAALILVGCVVKCDSQSEAALLHFTEQLAEGEACFLKVRD